MEALMELDMGKERIPGRAKIIKELREKRGWSQAQLAQVSGLSERTIQRTEKDGSASLDTLQAFAAAFDISVDQLTPPTARKDAPQPKLFLLPRLKTGKQLFDIVGSSHLFQFDHDEPNNEEGLEAISSIVQDLRDYGDIWGEIEPGERIKVAFQYNERIVELERLGYFIFGHRRKVIITSSGTDAKSSMDLAVIVIKDRNHPAINRDAHGNEVMPCMIETGKQSISFG
jgi:transcriptional regulator with XRE-family HTH domain